MFSLTFVKMCPLEVFLFLLFGSQQNVKLILHKATLITTSHFRPRDDGPEGMEPDGVIEVGDS